MRFIALLSAPLSVFCAVPTAPANPSTNAEWDLYCQSLNQDPVSYCKVWNTPSLCTGGDQPCGTGSVPAYTSTTSTAAPSTTAGATQTVSTVQPQIPACDYYCQAANGPTSYCKYYLAIPTCQGNDAPCLADTCSAYTTSTTTTTTQPPPPRPEWADNCDSYCIGLNGATSYCKYWQGDQAASGNLRRLQEATTAAAPAQSLCNGGNQVCNASICAAYTTSSTLAPSTTGAVPASETAAETTAAPVAETTAAPAAETTAAPADTTAAPAESTAAPVETTSEAPAV